MQVSVRLAGGLAGALVLALPLLAQAQDVKRTEIQRHDLTGTQMEVIEAIVEAPPGALLPRHYHNGEEAFYVIEGASVQSPDGKTTVLATGSSGLNVREVPHAGWKVVGDKTLKLLTVHVVDKGKPLSVPAP
jgi:quercetin dioxygenase-like cupin family protein